MEKINAVVIGGLHHNTLGVIRSLGETSECDIQVLLLGDNLSSSNFISKSKYVKQEKMDSVPTSDKIVPWLLTQAKDGLHRVIVCCSDEVAEVVINNYDLLKGHYWLPSSIMPITKLMDKEEQSLLAQACGLRVPVGIVVNKSEPFDWNEYPCIIKPIKSAVGAGKNDIKICANKDELFKSLDSIKAEIIQVQKYVHKKMEFQLIGCSLNAGKEIVIPGYTNILRQPPNTNTGYLIYSPIEQFSYDREAVFRFIREIGYSGLFSVEFIRDDNDTDYFLEINMRNDGNGYCVFSAGVNLPFIWCYYQIHKELPNISLSFEKPVYFIPDFVDVQLGIREKGIWGWFIEFLKAESHAVYNTKDMKPFWHQAKLYVRRILQC